MAPDHAPAGGAPAKAVDWSARLALALLMITLVTGLPLAALWRADAPRASLELLSEGLPLGWLLRNLHFVSSTLLVIAALVHVAVALWRRDALRCSGARWLSSLSSLPLLLLAGLGGFVLRGDAEARAALSVWQGLLDTLPLVGASLRVLLIGPREHALDVVALQHVGGLSLALLAVSVHHGGLRWPDRRSLVIAAAVTFVLSSLLQLPLGAPIARDGELLGPWTLLGVQGLLRHLPVGLIWPLLLGPLLLLWATRPARGRLRQALILALAFGALAYLVLSVRVIAS